MHAPPSHRPLVSAACIMAIAAAACGGCSHRVSIDTWRKAVEASATTGGELELNALRGLDEGSPRPRLAVFSAKSPDSSMDVVGVMLGRREIQAQPCCVFIVGIVNKQQLQDVRIALVSDAGGKAQWRISPADPPALTAYLSHREHRWRTLQPQRQEAPWSFAGFPTPYDQFRLAIAGDAVTVIEDGSGAQWSLKLSPG